VGKGKSLENVEGSGKPEGIKVLHENIPEELKRLDQWVGWRWQKIGTKWTKVPYDLKTNHNASTDDPETWSAYELASEAGHEGIGFVFSETDPYCGIDLDGCVDQQTGELSKEAKAIISRLASYSEISPSGSGVKVFVKASLASLGPRRKNPARGIEVYDSLRFFTVTGHIMSSGTAEGINERQEAVDALYRWLFPEPSAATPAASGAVSGVPANTDLDDQTILSKAWGAANGDKFARLWNGDTSGYGSHSEADLALCSMLAFWTGPDPARIEELFSQSGLNRGKWQDRPAYRKKTVEKALSTMSEFYDANRGITVTLGKPTHHEDVSGRGASLPSSPFPAPLPEAPPFPTHALPEAVGNFVREAALSTGVPEDYVGVPALAALAQGIGAARVVQIKRRWKEGTTLFLAIVSPPGTKKSPAADAVMAPVWERHFRLEAEHEEAEEEYDLRVREHEAAEKLAKKTGDTPPERPKSPTPKRCITVDVTVEALVDLVANNPRGILVYRDELTGWVAAMDQYKGGKGSDKQHWLSLWSASPIAVDRKSQMGKAISVKRPSVSLFGGIQPAVLRELGNTAEEGLIERFLFSYPEYRRGRFTFDEVSYEAEAAYSAFYEELTSRYQMLTNVETDKQEPNVTPMSHEAKLLFARLADELTSQTEEPGFPHRLKGAYSKLEAYLGRLSLILALCRCVATDEAEQVEEGDVEAAYELVKYFAAHARRVHGETGAITPEDLFAGELRDFLEDEGGSWRGTTTELMEALTERGAEHAPDDVGMLGKMVRAVGAQNPGLEVTPGHRGKGKESKPVLKLKLVKRVQTPPDPSDQDSQKSEGSEGSEGSGRSEGISPEHSDQGVSENNRRIKGSDPSDPPRPQPQRSEGSEGSEGSESNGGEK
jgi:putative DNA primase/helicase